MTDAAPQLPQSTQPRTASPNVVLAIIIASYLMMLIDVSIVITGLPQIQSGLHFSPASLSWVQNAYTLAFGCLLLLGARAGDLWGRKRMFLAGLSLFTLASLAIGIAQSPAWLITGRAVQGVGAAILAPSTLALLSTHFAEGPARTRAMALYAAAAGVGASVGLVLGGVLADFISWRVGFFINVPIGMALLLSARRYLADAPRPAQKTPSTNGLAELDVAGAASSTLGMGALVYGIVRAAEDGWGDRITQSALLLAVVMLVFFLFHESRMLAPILPLRLFNNRARNGAYAGRMLFMAGMMGFWFFTTQYLQGVLGMRPWQAGIAFLPTTVVNFALAMAVPRLTQRIGNARVLCTGLAVSALGMAWLGQIGPDSSYVMGVALPMLLIGAGQGCTLGPLTVAGVAGIPAEDAGAGSGLVNAAQQIGGSLGLGLMVVATALGRHASEPRVALAHHVAAATNTAAVFLAAALVVVWLMVVRQPQATSRQAANAAPTHQ